MTDIDIIHVVAKSTNHCIGKDNQLLWHIPADLQHFKNITTGGVIVMGRKTFESLGRLLPNRSHHIITRDTTFHHDGVTVSHTLDDAIAAAKADAAVRGQSAIYILGGGEIYQQSLVMADRLEITEVDIDITGDAYYPVISDDFIKVAQSDTHICDKSGLAYRFVTYQKTKTA
ncbi:dihydrofolate reductase [uncultured Moraxella sp.]|uniref:dihydrofolate reductase n=1 Tax=uncultured Moraxella sp. TaxID=263769 RepID=UPI0025D7BB31|nr:dihydrofolate reductase [uncultured Moraxella sp.]